MTNPSIKTTVLKNLKLSLNADIDKLIAESEANEKYQSKELTENFWLIQARGEFNQVLLNDISNNIKQSIHTAKNMNS